MFVFIENSHFLFRMNWIECANTNVSSTYNHIGIKRADFKERHISCQSEALEIISILIKFLNVLILVSQAIQFI